MQISKQEILDILQKNSLNKEQAEQILELFGKSLGDSLVDLIGLIVVKTPNAYDDMAFGAIENKLRSLVSDLEITL
jgi:hypothetical protein